MKETVAIWAIMTNNILNQRYFRSAFELRSRPSHLLYNLIQTGIEINPARLNPADHKVPSGGDLSSSDIMGNQGVWLPLLTPMMYGIMSARKAINNIMLRTF